MWKLKNERFWREATVLFCICPTTERAHNVERGDDDAGDDKHDDDPWPWSVYIWCMCVWFVYPWCIVHNMHIFSDHLDMCTMQICIYVWCTHPWSWSLTPIHVCMYGAYIAIIRQKFCYGAIVGLSLVNDQRILEECCWGNIQAAKGSRVLCSDSLTGISLLRRGPKLYKETIALVPPFFMQVYLFSSDLPDTDLYTVVFSFLLFPLLLLHLFLPPITYSQSPLDFSNQKISHPDPLGPLRTFGKQPPYQETGR